MNKKQFDKAISMTKLAKLTNKHKISVVGVSVKDQQITSLTSVNENYTITIGIDGESDSDDAVITIKTDDISKLANIKGYDISIDEYYHSDSKCVTFLCESTNVTLNTSDIEYSIFNDKRKYTTLTDMFTTNDMSGFIKSLKHVGKFASKDDTRPIFTGLQFNREVSSDYIHIIGLDGFRILDIQHKCTTISDFDSFVLPMQTINLLLKAIDKDASNIEFKITDSSCIYIHINYKDNTYVSLVSDTLKGDFLKYDTVFNTESKVNATVKPDIMHNELKEIHAVIGDSKVAPTKLSLKDNKMKLLSMDANVKIEKNIDIDRCNGDIECIAFNQKYMMEALDVFKQFNKDNIQFNYNNKYAPIILNDEYSLIRALILPIRINK